MPYATNKDLPEHIKKYRDKVQSQWRKVFNSVYAKVLKETKRKSEAEVRAFKAANSILKKRFKNGSSNELQKDVFNVMIDEFLGNLQG
jgi:cation transport regulator ChaB